MGMIEKNSYINPIKGTESALFLNTSDAKGQYEWRQVKTTESLNGDPSANSTTTQFVNMDSAVETAKTYTPTVTFDWLLYKDDPLFKKWEDNILSLSPETINTNALRVYDILTTQDTAKAYLYDAQISFGAKTTSAGGTETVAVTINLSNEQVGTINQNTKTFTPKTRNMPPVDFSDVKFTE